MWWTTGGVGGGEKCWGRAVRPWQCISCCGELLVVRSCSEREGGPGHQYTRLHSHIISLSSNVLCLHSSSLSSQGYSWGCCCCLNKHWGLRSKTIDNQYLIRSSYYWHFRSHVTTLSPQSSPWPCLRTGWCSSASSTDTRGSATSQTSSWSQVSLNGIWHQDRAGHNEEMTLWQLRLWWHLI